MVNDFEHKNFRQDQLLLGLDVELGPIPQYLIDEPALDPRSVSIKKAKESDVLDILRLMRGLAVYEGLDHFMVATEQDLRAALFGFQCNAEALVAFLDDECVAYAIFFPTFCGMRGQRGVFLENIFVDPEVRDCGIGKALFGRVAALALQRGAVALHWRVLNDNTSAIGFYSAQGAEIMSEWSTCRMNSDAIEQLVIRNRAVDHNGMQPSSSASSHSALKEVHDGEIDEPIRRSA